MQSAVELFHREGIQAVSIAEVARNAGIPAGNVFYYFRTKADLVRAVAEHWLEKIDSTLESLHPEQLPEQRLFAFFDLTEKRADSYATLGCPLIALSRDLRRSGDRFRDLAQQLVARQVDWIDRLLEDSGLSRTEARRRALTTMALLQGSFQLAFTLGDPGVVSKCIAELKGVGLRPGPKT